jgi:pilus assembly protein CpaE
MIDRAMAAEKNGVRVLASKPETLSGPTLEAGVMRKIVTLLRSAYSYTALDLGFGVAPAALEAMRLSEAVVVVSRIDVPGIRLTRNYLNTLVEAGIPKNRLQVVMNRYGQNGQMQWKKAEAALPMPAAIWVPDDPRAVNHALNDGQPVVQNSRSSSMARRFAELAAILNGKKTDT